MQPVTLTSHLATIRRTYCLITSKTILMNRCVVYVAVSLLFSACSYVRNWQGTNNPQLVQAKFDVLQGKQSFVLRVPSNDTYLAYRFNETAGDLKASIKSPSAVVFAKAIDASEKNSVHLVDQKGAIYTVVLSGKRASGDMDVRFRPSPE